MKILIIKFRHIGDVLLTTPLISNLKHYYPQAKIDILVNKGTEAMVTQNPNLNQTIAYDKQSMKVGGIFSRIKNEVKFALNLRANNYDMVIQTTSGDRGLILSLVINPKILVAYPGGHWYLNYQITHKLPPYNCHIVDANLDALRALGHEPKDKKVKIFFDDFSNKFIDLPKIFVHIHAMSRWMFKCVDDDLMANLIDFIELELGTRTILTTDKSEVEVARLKSILKRCKSTPIVFMGSLSLKEVAFLNSKSALFLGVDTAIMHMAAANEVPVIALFGPSIAKYWGPWDNDFTNFTYNGRGNQAMGRHFIFQKDWNCVPCNKAGCDNSKISSCLIEFTKSEIQAIKDKIKEKLNEYIIH